MSRPIGLGPGQLLLYESDNRPDGSDMDLGAITLHEKPKKSLFLLLLRWHATTHLQPMVHVQTRARSYYLPLVSPQDPQKSILSKHLADDQLYPSYRDVGLLSFSCSPPWTERTQGRDPRTKKLAIYWEAADTLSGYRSEHLDKAHADKLCSMQHCFAHAPRFLGRLPDPSRLRKCTGMLRYRKLSGIYKPG